MTTDVRSRRWRYTAADASGRDVAGEVDAPSERDAVDVLRRRALWVIALEPIGGAPVATERANTAADETSTRTGHVPASTLVRALRFLNGSDAAELAVTMRAMSALLGAGVPLDRALSYAAGGDGGTAQAFASVREAVRGGESLSNAMAAQTTFPAVFAPTIAAGEVSGSLASTLTALADHLDRSSAIRARLRAALAYPAMLGIASIVALVVIMLVVVPRFAALVSESGGALPVSTRMLVAVSAFVSRWWWLIALAGIGSVAAARQWLAGPGNRNAWDAGRLAWPVVGHFERTSAAAAYTGVLAVALRSGVSLLGAMGLARKVVRNSAIALRLEEAEDRVRTGSGLAAALTGSLPPLSVRLLEAGEAGGDLAGMAARAADAADSELQRVASGAVSLVEPALILAFGGLVGFVALALLQAIYGLNARTL